MPPSESSPVQQQGETMTPHLCVQRVPEEKSQASHWKLKRGLRAQWAVRSGRRNIPWKQFIFLLFWRWQELQSLRAIYGTLAERDRTTQSKEELSVYSRCRWCVRTFRKLPGFLMLLSRMKTRAIFRVPWRGTCFKGIYDPARTLEVHTSHFIPCNDAEWPSIL